jgi:hypothetical protein
MPFDWEGVAVKPNFVLFILLVLLQSGCMTDRFRPGTDFATDLEQPTILVKKISHDEHGRPLFSERLIKRPVHSGEEFSLVYINAGKPVRSYDIVIVKEQQADMVRPLAIVYEWTGKGFEAGLSITGNFLRSGVLVSSRDDALAILAMEAAPIVIGGVTGFVVGVVYSIPETATEMRRVIINTREALIGYTAYEYDEKGRIRSMKMYPPAANAEELVKTEFIYEGENRDPSKTEVTSLIEKKTRLIQ